MTSRDLASLPFVLPDRSLETPVIQEEGDERQLLVSTSYNGKRPHVILHSAAYDAHWRHALPQRFSLRLDRQDTQPLAELGLSARLTTDHGEDIPLADGWTILSPTSAQYRNGPYFFRQMERCSLLFQAPTQQGGLWQLAVTCTPQSVELAAAYFPPVGWEDAHLSCATLLLAEDASGSRLDGDVVFSPVSVKTGEHLHPMDEPAWPEDASPLMAPPFCFPIRRKNRGEWFSLSVEPPREGLTFSRFTIQPTGNQRVVALLDYASPVPISTCMLLPPIVLRLGAQDPYDALRCYADALVQAGLVQRPRRQEQPWWRKPIACGWREQTLCMLKTHTPAYDHCTQATYQHWVDAMEALEIPFSTLVIDAIWSKAEEIWEVDQNKWPDMRGFIEQQHQKGRRVLLWVCPNCGGLPDEEAYITTQAAEEIIDPDAAQFQGSKPQFSRLVDPLSPAYRARVRRCLETMLGNGANCLHADGIKLDYTGRLPVGRIVRCTRPLYGYQYLDAQLRLFHDAAKAVRPDCLLEFQVANPYLADTFDMARLNDYLIAPGINHAFAIMADRAHIAQAVNFDAIIDTDGIRSPIYLRRASELGVPAIYLGIDDFKRCPDYILAAQEASNAAVP